MTRRIRTRADKRRRAAADTARRQIILILLARLDRPTGLTTEEAELLRTTVTAECAAHDRAQATTREQGAALRRQAEQLDAAHEAIREAEQGTADAGEQLAAYRAVEKQRQAVEEQPARPEVCCVCGHGPVAYHNYREQPFCWPCADGQPAPTTLTPEPQS